MKKISIYLLGITFILAGCQKKSDDLINGQTVDQRLTAALAAYQTALTSATYGWILLENSATPNNGGQGATNLNVTFAYYMQFNDQNQVTQYSDFDTTMLATPKSSSYRIKALQRPTLIFDTYSYIHVPCDPDPSVSLTPLINTLGPGAGGLGWGTDFEFEFSDSTAATQLGDTIHLSGLANQASAVLIKATKAQHDAYVNGTAKNTVFLNKILNYFKRVTSSRITFDITPAAASNASPSGIRNVDISWLVGTRLNTMVTSISYVGNSIIFSNPIGGTGGISSIDNINWNATTGTATGTVLGTAATIAGATAPLKNDTTAPWNWFVNGLQSTTYGYWTANTVHVNGKDDGLNFAQWSDYAGFMIYVPLYDTVVQAPGANLPTVYRGLLSPITVVNGAASLAIGSLCSASFTPGTSTSNPKPQPPTFKNGLFYYNFLADYGTATGSDATYLSSIKNTLSSAGHYLVLKDDGISYDMVISTDAKTWVMWR